MSVVSFVGKFFLFSVLLFTSTFFYFQSRNFLLEKKFTYNYEDTPLYLPKKEAIKYIAFGYNTLAAKIFWFDTLNYVGKRIQEKKDFPWLYKMCDLITTLDPKSKYYIEFCSTALSWIAHDPQSTIEILNTGINEEPNYWKYRYLRGFNYWYFFKRYDLAKDDLTLASSMSDAPSFIASLASRLINQEDGAKIAKDFLVQTINNTNNAKVKNELVKSLRQAILSEDFEDLTREVKRYYQSYNKYPLEVEELIDKKYISTLPIEPFGGKYFINPEDGSIYSSSGQRGLIFNAKTFDTGILRDEFINKTYELSPQH